MTRYQQPRSLFSRRPSANAEAADLDVLPVMNMFIILIPFLISMSAFLHLAAHEFNLPKDDGSGQAVFRNDLPITVAVGHEGFLVVQGDLVLAELPNQEGGLDYPGLTALLKIHPPKRLMVAVDDQVTTSDLVLCLDAIRSAGCTDIGLAAGVGVVLSAEANK